MNLDEFAALSTEEQKNVLAEGIGSGGIKVVYFDGDELDCYVRASFDRDREIMAEIEATIEARIAAMRDIHEARLREEAHPQLFDGEPTEADFRKGGVPGWVRNIFNEKLAIEETPANQRGDVGYIPRALVQATLPYKDPRAPYFVRKNGNFQLRIFAGHGGIPYGVYPRLLVSWVATEAVRTKSPVLTLGDSLSSFLNDVMEIRSKSGGVRGSATRVLDQMKRLFTSHIDASFQLNSRKLNFRNVSMVDEIVIDDDEIEGLWVPQKEQNAGEWQSILTLSEKFYQGLVEAPVPIDVKAFKALRGSPLSMDIYAWLTYRAVYLTAPSRPIPWASLMFQFGSGMGGGGDIQDKQAVRDFKKAFLKALPLVKLVYEAAAFEVRDEGLVLLPTLPHIEAAQLRLDLGGNSAR